MRTQRLLDLYQQAAEAAQRDPALLPALLKEWAYVYRRCTLEEQGAYHTLVSAL